MISSSLDAPDVIQRRRDKRRHISNSENLDIRNPYSVIALAVRYDESMGQEELLKTPLEQGSIYDQKSFANAMLTLQKKTAPPRALLSSTTPRTSVSSYPGNEASIDTSTLIPLTPTILSGLLNATRDEDAPSSTELVTYCQSMRRKALARLRVQQRRLKIQRTAVPILLVITPLVLYIWTMLNVKHVLIQFGFVDLDCCATHVWNVSNASPLPCRMAEAKLWERLQPSPNFMGECSLTECAVMEGQEESPLYAMHTRVSSEFIPLYEVQGGSRRTMQHTYRRKGAHGRKRSNGESWSSLEWLGDTEVNRLVRTALVESLAKPSELSALNLLDVGCGIGGTLYPLLRSNIQWKEQVSYTGIAISKAEVDQARQLQEFHQLDSDRIAFVQHDFDSPLPQSFSAMVAIESLSYSPDLNHTLRNLASSLRPKSTVVILEDVVAPWAETRNPTGIEYLRKLTGRASLITHKKWKETLAGAGLSLQEVRDLGLEMELPDLLSVPVPSNAWNLVADWRQQTAQFFLRRWSHWMAGGTKRATTGQRAFLRTMQLVQDLVQNIQGEDLRHYAYYRTADLSYFMYICTKI